MKKILTTTALAALISLSAEAKFYGFYAGAQTSYSTNTANLKSKVTTSQASTKPSGHALGINGGYGCNHGSIYLGVEGQTGYDWAKHTNGSTGFQAKKGWFASLGGRAGVHATDNLLAYLYLGMQYNIEKLSMTSTTLPAFNSIKKTAAIWSYVPGIGLNYKLTNNMYLDASYKYAKSFSQTRPKFYTWNKSPVSNIFTLGVGYQF